MPRIARTVIPGVMHHITQRGNNRQDVFFVDDDRRTYLDILKRESARHGLKIHAYCLMTNHIHIVAMPQTQKALSSAIGRTHFAYTQYINRLHGRHGHLWQNRFYSCPMDDRSCPAVIRYVETNPVRARMVRRPWRYPWSSAAAHTGAKDTLDILDTEYLARIATPESWKQYLIEKQDQNTIDLIRARTSRGRPLGSDSFISKLEHKLGRRLRALPHGRPRKENSSKEAR